MLKRGKKIVVMLLATTITMLLSSCGDINQSTTKGEGVSSTEKVAYEGKLFDTSYVHEINIEISDEDWADLIANPLEKTKYEVNVTIDDETIEDVSFATKGNTSLSSVASDEDSDRYSFKVNFGKYVDGQTYYGLDKLNLNNTYADATYMKDYLSYQIFTASGVESPLTSYIVLKINGEEFGLYLAIEEIGDSYLARTEAGEGELYKPETTQLANMGEVGGGKNQEMPESMEPPENGTAPEPPEGVAQPGAGETPEGMQPSEDGIAPELPERVEIPENGENQKDMKQNGFGSSSNGASLQYTDDEVTSYSDIFDNAETNSEEEDWNRVIRSLQKLSDGDVEDALDTDEVIRYFAAHNFVLNYDSYTGNMLHNYYLYENDGTLSILPWDYNLAFGAFSQGGQQGKFDKLQKSETTDNSAASTTEAADNSTGSDATVLINTGIATPLSGALEEDRPFWSFITSDDTYLEQYYAVYEELLTNYFENGEFDQEIDRVYNMIRPYVEKDTSAFYTVDEFDEAYSVLKEFCLLRAESIRKQLNGELSTDSSSQNSADQVDASEINITTMGSQSQGNKKR